MPSERLVRRVPHSAGQMFDLVADMERYPEFLPGCRDLEVLSREESEGAVHLVVVMRVGYRRLTERFTSKVRADRGSLAIDVDYVDGPMHNLTNRWRFGDLEGGGSEIDFRIAFELKSRRLGLLVSALFDRVFLRFVDAFEKRAEAVYGRP
jgi:coenzyme Q-binding protein COQ10